MKQSALNLFTEIDVSKRAKLDHLLAQYQTEWFQSKSTPLAELGTIHFCRWVILEEMITDGKTYPARLFFETNYDGDSPNDHIEQIVRQCGETIDAVYSNCLNYPLTGNQEEKVTFLTKCIGPTTCYFNGAPKRDLKRILKEDKLRNIIWNYLNSKDNKGHSPKTLLSDIQEHIRNNKDLAWVEEKATIPWINIPGLLLLGIVTILTLPFIIILALIIRIFYEPNMVPLGITPGQIDTDHMNKLEANEDILFQNQFSQMLYMRTSLARRLSLFMAMQQTKALGTYMFVDGKLLGIPTIHFARWISMDNGKHMFFTSNFDGSWQQYLGDFIDKSGWGLSLIFSNSYGFPKTKFLITGGAYKEEEFLAWSRYYQIPTQFWYSAYPSLSIKNIINNSYIRRDILKNLSEKQAEKLLRRF